MRTMEQIISWLKEENGLTTPEFACFNLDGGIDITDLIEEIEGAWKRERDELIYSFDPTKAAKSKAPDPSAHEMDGLMRDPAYREILSDGRNEENKPKSDWTVREALDFANTLANHGWTREANSDAASSCIYALCRMLNRHGNAAALREALERIHTLVNSLDEECGVDPIEIRDIARAALDEPPRNCDVGTPEEHEERWHKNCGSGIPNCKNCKVYGQGKESGLVGDRGFLRCSCRFIWAQMPYAEEGGAK